MQITVPFKVKRVEQQACLNGFLTQVFTLRSLLFSQQAPTDAFDRFYDGAPFQQDD